jgi:hypothetical protein
VTGEPQRTFEQTAMMLVPQPRDVIKSLPGIVAREITIESGDAKSLLIQHRQTPSADLYLCFNDSDRILDCRLVLPHARRPSGQWLQLRTETGEIFALGEAQGSVPLLLTPHASVVLLYASHAWQTGVADENNRIRRPVVLFSTRADALETALPLEGPWTIQVVGNALDEAWGPTPGDTILELPAFRHRAREFQPVSGWELRDYDDSNWEKVYAVRDGALFEHSSPVLLRGVLPPGVSVIETPLPVTGEYVMYADGVELDRRLGPPPQPGRIFLPSATTESGGVIAIETTSHSGPAGLQGPLRVVCGPVEVERLEPWSKWNLPWYCGRVLYRTEIKVPQPDLAKLWVLDLGQVQHYAEVWLNDRLVGTLRPPYQILLNQYLRNDRNDLVLIISNPRESLRLGRLGHFRGTGKPEPSGLAR